MAPATPDVPTRDRILFAAAELFRRQGYAATGLKQIVHASDASFGSIYHFFPGGKEQLGDDVIRVAGEFFRRLYVSIAQASPDAPGAIEAFFAGAAQTLRDTDYADACPIATVALEVASTNESLRRATADVFESWLAEVEGTLTGAGADEAEARRLALALLALLEGAFMLSRALRSTEPMDAGAQAAVALVEGALRE